MINEVSMFDPLKSPSNKQPYSDPIFISIHKNDDGLPVSKMIQNEIGTIIDRKIVLKEIPDRLHPIEISGYFEVDEAEYIKQTNQFWVDYQYGVIWFHYSIQEKTQITISKYYGVGLWLLPSSRIYMEVDENSVVSTIDDFFSSIKSYVFKNGYSNTIPYKVNEMVYYNGSTYICLQECTGITPENVSYWSVMTAGLSMKGNWSSSETYRERDIVTVDGNKLYLALKSSTNQNPTTASTYWEAMLDLTTFATYLDQQIARANQEITALQNKIGEYDNTLKPDILDKTSKANQATTNANTATTNVNNALQEYKDSALLSLMIHKEPVETFAQIAISYPNPQNGWTVKVLSDSKIYRYDGINANRWEFIDVGTGSAEINAINNKIGDLSQLNTTAKDSLVNAVKEVNNNTKNFATTAEAEAGLDDTKLMTPKKVKESIKANATGGGVSLQTFKSGTVDGTFTATVATDNFTIPNWNTRKDIESIVHENLFLVKDQDYSINQSTGLVTLTWTLAIGDKIHWKHSNQSYDYNELVNTPNIGNTENLTTTSKEVVGAVNELFQLANSGKTVIATSVGSPLQSSDTFSSMGLSIEKIKTDLTNAVNAKKALADGYVPPDLGNATADKVLTGSTFSSSAGENINGTMTNNGDISTAIANAILKAGFTTGGTIANCIAGNIKNGINIAGIVGNYNGDVKFAKARVDRVEGTSYTVNTLTFKPTMIIVHALDGRITLPNTLGVGFSTFNYIDDSISEMLSFSQNDNISRKGTMAERPPTGVYATTAYKTTSISATSTGFTVSDLEDYSKTIVWYAVG